MLNSFQAIILCESLRYRKYTTSSASELTCDYTGFVLLCSAHSVTKSSATLQIHLIYNLTKRDLVIRVFLRIRPSVLDLILISLTPRDILLCSKWSSCVITPFSFHEKRKALQRTKIKILPGIGHCLTQVSL